MTTIENKMLKFDLDRPLKFRYAAQTQALSIEAYSPSLQASTGVPILRIDMTPEALQALILLVNAISSNPDKDIEGGSAEPNVQ